jgi:hypothetical protein
MVRIIGSKRMEPQATMYPSNLRLRHSNIAIYTGRLYNILGCGVPSEPQTRTSAARTRTACPYDLGGGLG